MKKRIIIISSVVIAIIILIALYVNFFGYITINDIRFTNIYTKENIFDKFAENYEQENSVFIDENLDTTVTYTYTNDEINNSNIFTIFIAKLTHKNYDMFVNYTVDESALRGLLSKINSEATPTKDAYIDIKDDRYAVIPEEQGDNVDIGAIISAVNNNETHIDLSDYYIKPSIYTTDLEKYVDEANVYLDWSCTYINGEVVKASTDDIVLDNNNELHISSEFINEFVNGTLVDKYNTKGGTITFTDHNGNSKTNSGGLWGNIVNTNAEIEYLTNCLTTNPATIITDRKPEYTIEMSENMYNDFIEISIQDQHIWVHKDGEIINESDIVTGTNGRRDTPKGNYYIMEHLRNKIMRGPGYATPCSYWMRLTYTGVGLHDATWRGSFGGNIYTYNGSHGCVNLPYSFAKWLYENTTNNELVVIY